MTHLPICETTDIPRLLCAHCDSFTMTDAERAYIAGHEVYAPATSAPPVVRQITEYSGGSWSEPRDVKVHDSSTICRTPNCTRPAGDAFVCAPCIDDLEMCLGDVPRLVEDLDVLAMRQARFAAQGKGTDRTPLPVNLAATERRAYLNNALVTAVRQITEQRGLPKPALDGPTAVSRWLLAHVQSVAMDEAGGDIVADMRREHARAMRAIDCPPDRTYIGTCDQCRAPMHADESEAEHQCRDCGAEYVIADRLESQRDKIRSALLTTGQLEKVVATRYASLKVSRHRINRLVAQRRLIRRAHSREGGALYLADDLLKILEDEAADTAAG